MLYRNEETSLICQCHGQLCLNEHSPERRLFRQSGVNVSGSKSTVLPLAANILQRKYGAVIVPMVMVFVS